MDSSDPGPRERLLASGCESLSDAELLALLLRTGAPGRSVLELASALLRPGGLLSLSRAAPGELRRMAGIGPAKCAALLAAFELGRRLAGRRLQVGELVRSAEDIYRHFHPRLRDAAHERFLVVLLDGRHRVQREVLASQGTLTASLVHPREVFRPALQEGAAALVVVHNHPSGDPTPSREDLDVTRRLVRAGALLGIPVLDHVVVAERGYVSLREEGWIGNDEGPAGEVDTGEVQAPRGSRR